MPYTLGSKSRRKLYGVHPDLVAVVQRAIEITEQDFTVLEGLRTQERQQQLYSTGKSKTMNSRHLTGHAVDLAPWPITWDWDHFYPIADAVTQACKEVDVPIRWGGNWRVKDLREWEGTAEELVEAYDGKFYDLPHFEIPR